MKHLVGKIHEGIKGTYKGLKTGLNRFDAYTRNFQKGTFTVIGAAQKTGKSKFLIYRYVVGIYLNNPKANIHWIWYSPELDLEEVSAMVCSTILYLKYNIRCASDLIYSRGDNLIPNDIISIVESIYSNELVDLFGEYNEQGKLIKRGKITFFSQRENPTGIRNYLFNYAKEHGEIIFEDYETFDDNGNKVIKQKISSYKEKDPNLCTIVLYDHVGLLKRERAYNKKENIDKFSEYVVEMRNLFKFSFVVTSQFNRDLSKTERLKFSGEELSPTTDDFKDTGNLAEDCNILIALFDPGRYPHLHKHLGYDIRILDKIYRSIHILVARGQPCPVDLSVILDGETGFVYELCKKEELTSSYYHTILEKLKKNILR